jgi:phospholipase/lecithinase/hemolysin
VQKAVQLMVGFLLFGSAVFPAQAAFTMLQVFGDGISAMTNGPGGSSYYGQRNSNGRVWVEVLAQRQGLTLYPTNNWSYFGNTSTSMVASVASFTVPAGVSMSNILFVIWVNNADLFYPALNNGTSMNAWTNAMNVSLTNHFKAITNLYTKGARTLIMPNVVDLSTIPEFNSAADTNFVHQRCIDYNVAFTNTLNRARTNLNYPGLTIYMPDLFTLLTNIIAYPTNYTVINALYNGLSIDAIEDPSLINKSANGPGTNYIFWDSTDPTAKVHMWMANLTQQLISPAQISQFTALNGSNQLVMANVPIGQNGLVLGRTNLVLGSWTTNATFNSTNTTQTIFVTPSGPQWFYRLSFPYSWTWP